MTLPEPRRGQFLLLVSLLGIVYVGISVANAEDYAGDIPTDIVKLGLVIALGVVGFVAGRGYFHFTHTAPVFLTAMICLILYHITELTEEFALLQNVPLFGQVTLAKRAFETILVTASVCLFLLGNYLAASHVNNVRKQLELNVYDLQERERRYRTLFEAANDAIFIMKNDRFVHCNTKTLEIFGCAEDQIVGHTPYRFSPPTQPDGEDSREKAHGRIAQALAGAPQSFEWKHLRFDGTPFDAEVSLNLVQLGDGPYIQAIVRDVSERKAAEAERARLIGILEATSDFVSMATPDGHITYLNEAGRRVLGWTTDKVVRRPTIADAHPTWASCLIADEGIPAAIRNGTWAGETAIKGHDGEDVPVSQVIMSHRSEDGQLEYLSTIMRDLRQQKQAEQALRESEQTFRSIIEASPMGIHLYRLEEDDRLVFAGANPAADRLLGIDHAQFVGQSIEDAFPSLAGTEIPDRYRRVAGQGETWSTEQIDYDYNGISGSFEIYAFQMAPGRAAILFRDITERRRAERERLDYQRRLRSLASELSLAEERERRRIAAGLHDHACQALVLSKMKLQAMQASAPTPPAPEITGVCDTLDETIHSIRGQIFDLSSPTLYKFGLEAALAELLEDKVEAQYGIHCIFRNDSAPKPLAEDVQVLLFQSVRELLINTIKHADAREVTLGIVRSNDSVRITVADDGIGFDTDDVLSSPSRRRGFGLFNIKERLDYIGGALEMYSKPGTGSRFTLIAPLLN